MRNKYIFSMFPIILLVFFGKLESTDRMSTNTIPIEPSTPTTTPSDIVLRKLS